tara:strand:+ start:234 stop:476 length:243 start_codon:yes stop_codon:yes gene_type:complete
MARDTRVRDIMDMLEGLDKNNPDNADQIRLLTDELWLLKQGSGGRIIKSAMGGSVSFGDSGRSKTRGSGKAKQGNTHNSA